MLAMLLGAAALFFALDYFVSDQFARLRQTQIARSAAEVRRFVDAEGERLVSLATLLANDADLNHSTFYHLFLAGEREHPQAAVDRIGFAFDFDAVSLWAMNGRAIAAAPAAVFDSAPPHDLAPGSRIVELHGRPWLVADAPLVREGNPIAILRVAKSLENVLATGLPALYPTALRLVRGATNASAARVELPPFAIELTLPDTVGEALAEVKTVLATILVASGLMLALILGAYLRWQLRPLAALSAAAVAVGRGDFSQRVAAPAETEIGQLAAAFNAMSAGLGKLREMERRLAHQEQLSAIGRIAARVAHDINNPLTVIANTARLALKPPPADAQLAEDLRRIVHHGERCMRTLDLLLDYGRPVRVNSAPFELAELARGTARRWKATARVPASIPFEGDSILIEQMLDNLLANAREAAGPGGTVTLAAAALADEVQL
ncbi:MAG: two-component sensor histidine kinase, partial [Rhodocyclales bacterium CG_4_9_14_3_um_filter_68_10]